jgi:catechol 2,3-dioxygenase-like lactoylglutathione lyase family enzyme
MDTTFPAFGDPYHVGVVVQDMDRTIERYRSMLGMTDWAVRTNTVEAEYRGRRQTLVSRGGFSRWGDGYLELVQPIQGDSPATEFLRERGEGAYHVGYFRPQDELDAPLPGADIHFRVWDERDLVAVYLDTFEALGLYVEFVRAERAGEFAAWVAETTRPWTSPTD